MIDVIKQQENRFRALAMSQWKNLPGTIEPIAMINKPDGNFFLITHRVSYSVCATGVERGVPRYKANDN